MKYVLSILAALSAFPFAVQAQQPSKPITEYDIKAAFIHKFMLFTEWPKDKLPDGDEPFILTIVGKDPFGNAFEPLKNELVKGRRVVIKRYDGLDEQAKSDKARMGEMRQALNESHLLVICPSEEEFVKDILEMVSGRSILTVADAPGFAESGGMIGLSIEDAKVRFEINNVVTGKAGLRISSQLLRLAKRVVQDDSPKSGTK